MTRMFCDMCGREIAKDELPYSNIDFNGTYIYKNIGPFDGMTLSKKNIGSREVMCSYLVCPDCFTNVLNAVEDSVRKQWDKGKCDL